MDTPELALWAPICKMDASSRTIEGPISGPDNTDLDGQIVDTAWLRAAVGPWSGFGNIRQQHDPKKPVGKAVSVDLNTPDGVPVVRAKIVDDNAWKLIQEGVLSGFSIGVKNPVIVTDAAAPKGRIKGGNLVEVSVVDHPANMNAKFAVVTKAAGDEWVDWQAGDLVKGDLSAEARDHLADSSFAVPGKRKLPMHDLHHARLAWDMVDRTHGLSDAERAEARSRIRARLHELGGDFKSEKAAMGYESREHEELEHTQPGMGDGDADDCPCCARERDNCTCPADCRGCTCQGRPGHGADMSTEEMTAKAVTPPPAAPTHAGDFRSFQKADMCHPDKGTPSELGHAPEPGPEVTPEVSLEADIKNIRRLVESVAARLDSRNKAGFSPNANPASTREPARTESPDLHSRGPAAGYEDVHWDGEHPIHAGKSAEADVQPVEFPDTPFSSMTADEVYQIAKEAAVDALNELLGADVLNKAATPDSAKAALADTVKSFLAEGMAAYDERLAKVEGMAAASKGVASEVAAMAASKQFNLNAAERDVVEGHIAKAVSTLSDEDQLKLATQFLHSVTYGRGQ